MKFTLLMATAATAQFAASPYNLVNGGFANRGYGGYANGYNGLVGGRVAASPYGLAAPVASYGAYPAYQQYQQAPMRYAQAPVYTAPAPAPEPVAVKAKPKSNPMNMLMLYTLLSNDSVKINGGTMETYECDAVGTAASCTRDSGLDMTDMLIMSSMMKGGSMNWQSMLFPSLMNKDKWVKNKAGTGYLKTTNSAGINADYGVTDYSSKGKLDGLQGLFMFMAGNGVMGNNLPNDETNNNLLMPLLMNGLSG